MADLRQDGHDVPQRTDEGTSVSHPDCRRVLQPGTGGIVLGWPVPGSWICCDDIFVVSIGFVLDEIHVDSMSGGVLMGVDRQVGGLQSRGTELQDIISWYILQQSATTRVKLL